MAEVDLSTKACGKCKVVKAFSEFNKNKNRPDGLAWDCRACNKDRCKKHFIAAPEKYNAASKADYEKNKEKYLAQAKQWAAKNKEKRREVTRAYVKRNPEKRYETQKNNRISNPGYYRAHFKKRQQLKRKAMPPWANEAAIRAIYEECSRISKETGVKHHVDHFYPLQNELVCGLHCEYNLRIITAFDNLSKGNSFPSEEL
jgi:hypothetical protein